MNTFLKYLNKWANRLTVRILVMSGVSQESVNKVVEGFTNREQLMTQADNKLKGRFQWLKWFIITVFVALGVYIALNFNKITRKIINK